MQLDPHSIEAEAAVLSVLFRYPEVKHEVSLEPSDFYDGRHRAIYEAITAVDSVDILTVGNRLEETKMLDKAGGYPYLTRLHEIVLPAGNVQKYVDIVTLKSLQRKGMQIGQDIVQYVYNAETAEDIIAHINQIALSVSVGNNGRGPVSTSDAVSAFLEDVEYWKDNPVRPGEVRGLTTGFSDWDRMMNGMQPGDCVVLAARPRVGKTALTITGAHRIAKQGKNVLYFALEMTRKALIARLAAAESGVSFKKIKRGVSKNGSDWYATEEEYSKFLQAGFEIAGLHTFYIDDTPGLNTSQIRARASALAQRIGGIDLIVVDTGNLVNEERKKGENFAQTEGRKSQMIRDLAKELDCVVWMTWQLNRGVEMRPIDKRRPQLSDLRDTGEVEAHATDVIGLYRDVVYNPNTLDPKVMELLALKRREDEGNTLCKLGFEPEHQRFFQLERKKLEPVKWQT